MEIFIWAEVDWILTNTAGIEFCGLRDVEVARDDAEEGLTLEEVADIPSTEPLSPNCNEPLFPPA